MSFVIDASIALSWCLPGENDPKRQAILDRLGEVEGLAPQIWPLEVLNGLLMAERRGRINATERQRLMGFLRQLPITIDSETASRAWIDTADLAARWRLTSYDATYLELAIRAGVALATADTALSAAARAMGVEVLG